MSFKSFDAAMKATGDTNRAENKYLFQVCQTVIERAINTFDSENLTGIKGNYERFLLAICRRLLDDFIAAIKLYEIGMPTQAMSVQRSMFEHYIDVRFVNGSEDKEALAIRYFEFEKIGLYMGSKKFSADSLPIRVKKILPQYEILAKQFKAKYGTGNLKNWIGSPISERVNGETEKFLYYQLCQMTHCDVAGDREHIKFDGNSIKIISGPAHGIDGYVPYICLMISWMVQGFLVFEGVAGNIKTKYFDDELVKEVFDLSGEWDG